MRGESAIEVASFAVPFISFAPGFRMSIEPLNHAPSSMRNALANYVAPK